MNRKILLSALTAVGLSSFPAMAYDWTGTLLNNNADPAQCDVLKDADGKIIVYGTEGAWGGNHTKEQVFDGNADISSNYFDPPEKAAKAGGCWAGIGFARPKIVTAIRVNCRSGMRQRLNGCLIQGATTSDFSDAKTIHTISDDGKFGSANNELVKQGKDFEQLYLPGHTHNLGSEYITKRVFKFLWENCMLNAE